MASLNGVNPSLRKRIEWVIDTGKSRGSVFTVNTGFRSRDEQTRLYNAMLAAQKAHPYDWRKYAALAAKPGQSNHQHEDPKGVPCSLAVDLGCAPKDNALRIELFQRAGLCTPVPGEAWHAEERKNAAQPISVAKAAVTKAVDPVDALPYFIIPNPVGPGFWELKKSDGGVGAINGAPFFNSLPGVKARVVAPLAGLTPCVKMRKVGDTYQPTVIGYWIYDIEGRLYSFGQAPYWTDYASNPSWHSPNRTMASVVQTAGFAAGESIRYSQIGIEAGDADYVVDTYDIGIEMRKK